MNLSTDIKSVTYLKSKAADLLNQVNETHRPVIITDVTQSLRKSLILLMVKILSNFKIQMISMS